MPTFDPFVSGPLINVCLTPAGVTILLSLTVFLNMVAETMPATSDAVPLLGKKDERQLDSNDRTRNIEHKESLTGN